MQTELISKITIVQKDKANVVGWYAGSIEGT